MEAEDGATVEDDQAAEMSGNGTLPGGAGPAPEPRPASAPDPESEPTPAPEPEPASAAESESANAEAEALPDPEPEPESNPEPDDPDSDAGTVRRALPVTSGIGCAALLLPLIAVAGAILCFAAGILSTAGGCAPNGSALCSANGPWFAFALPLFVSPLIAAGTAIGAVTVRRHRSTWLAVGYGIVFISVIVGLASASTGSN